MLYYNHLRGVGLSCQVPPTSIESLNMCIALQIIVKLQAIIWREEDMFVIKEAFTGVTTQGRTIEEAMENLKEAIELYLEEVPEVVTEIH
jgi:predicted RNase H-like HicB family nuclease